MGQIPSSSDNGVIMKAINLSLKIPSFHSSLISRIITRKQIFVSFYLFFVFSSLKFLPPHFPVPHSGLFVQRASHIIKIIIIIINYCNFNSVGRHCHRTSWLARSNLYTLFPTPIRNMNSLYNKIQLQHKLDYDSVWTPRMTNCFRSNSKISTLLAANTFGPGNATHGGSRWGEALRHSDHCHPIMECFS